MCFYYRFWFVVGTLWSDFETKKLPRRNHFYSNLIIFLFLVRSWCFMVNFETKKLQRKSHFMSNNILLFLWFINDSLWSFFLPKNTNKKSFFCKCSFWFVLGTLWTDFDTKKLSRKSLFIPNIFLLLLWFGNDFLWSYFFTKIYQ